MGSEEFGRWKEKEKLLQAQVEVISVVDAMMEWLQFDRNKQSR